MGRTKRKSSDDKEAPIKDKKRRLGDGGDGILRDSSVFGELVSKAGFVLKKNDKPNEITKDQGVFMRSLTVALKRHPDYPQVLDEFMEGFQKHIENHRYLKKSLMPSLTPVSVEASCGGATQDSLARLLLRMDLLQPRMLALLMEKLAEFTGDEEAIFEDAERVNLPRLILTQMRWLDRLVESEELVEKMFEILSVTNEEIQAEIIASIPEVIEDPQHAQVASKLRDLLLENNRLATPILDTLSNLSLTSDLLAEVRATVIQTLDSVDLDDLPVVVKFLLQTVTPGDALQIVTELRSKLDFPASLPPDNCSTPHAAPHATKGVSREQCKVNDSVALIVDALRSAIRFHKTTAEAWIKSIESVQTAAEHKVEDVLILFILHANNHRRAVESLLRNKLRTGMISEMLLQAAITSHGQVLREYFPSVLSLGEALLRSPEAHISHCGCAMYKHAFLSFDAYCKQELVGSLVTHIGSGLEGEVDAALDILLQVVNTNVAAMAPYAVFIKGVLDYLDHLSVSQIRKLYAMLSALAFTEQTDQSQMQDELYIIIRKQLTNNDPKYQRMGVIGAVMIVKSLGSPRNDLHQTLNQTGEATQKQQQQQKPHLADQVYQQVIGLLQLVMTSANRSPLAAALFMDELATVIRGGTLDDKVEAWVAENVISDFQDAFVMDVEPGKTEGTAVLPWTLQYGLDSESESSIGINLLPLLAECPLTHRLKVTKQHIHRKQSSLLYLAPQFRLLQICESRQHDGDLEGIDALLGCPVAFPQGDMFDKVGCLSQKEKELLCDSIFLTINWFRETVNAFACQTDSEMKAKVVTRLQNMSDLHSILDKVLVVTPNYLPPPADFDSEGSKSLNLTQTTSSGKPGRKAAGKRGKKAKGNKADSDDEGEQNTTVASPTQKESQAVESEKDKSAGSKKESGPQWIHYRHHLRELDLRVFSILQVGLITRTALDSELNTKAVETLRLQPKELCLLLEDLASKLDHALPASNRRRSPFKSRDNKACGYSHLDQLTPKAVVAQVLHFLPSICEHLEATSAYFQSLAAASDGVIDGPAHNTPETQLMSQCFHLLLQCLLALFSWNGLSIPDNRSLLKEALNVLASRLNTHASSQTMLVDVIKQSFQYTENLAGTAPSLPSAVTLCKLLTALATHCPASTEDYNHSIAALCEGFLKREWFGADGLRAKGAAHNDRIHTLLKLLFVHSDDVLACLENIAAVGMPELIDTDKNGSSTTYPTLTRGSFPVFYKSLLEELVQLTKPFVPGKPTDSQDSLMEKLLRWNMAVRVFHILVNLVKIFDGRSNLTAVLKYGRMFLELFLRLGMPMLDYMFRGHKESIQSLLKNVQLSTRALQHICSHSKIIKDVSLTNQVPQLRKVLEAFVYRVKAMLTLNNCLEAFWLGNLKNRDLQGEEILSQSTRVDSTQQDSDNEGDALPMGEDSDSEADSASVVSRAESEDSSRRDEEDEEEASYSDTF